MKISEIILEVKDTPADGSKLHPEQFAALKGAVSIPGISMNKANGSSYLAYRFGLALAGAPDYPTKAAGAIAGDPLLATYTDAELEIINSAAEMVGAGKVIKMNDNRSTEAPYVNKTSPVQPRGPIQRRQSSKK
jgi:hypothetical protein